MDTIFALASGRPPCGVSVIRLSGSRSRETAERLVGCSIAPRKPVLRSIRDRNGDIIDHGLVIYFEGPASFTGEDVVEFQVHGSLAVVRDLEMCLSHFPLLRAAEPGEFTQRAFLNGKIDLTEAEGLADLIHAETKQQRNLALRQAGGETHRLMRRWKDELLHLRAMVEASIDFADEDDVADDVDREVAIGVDRLKADISRHLVSVDTVDNVRNGFLVVLSGPPNVGKSSLFNALVREDRVLVSDVPGTTRDYVEQRLDWDGYLIRLVDTAGLRDTDDLIESAGVALSRQLLLDADIVLELSENGKFEYDRAADQHVVRVLSKSDIAGVAVSDHEVVVSVRDRSTVDALRHYLIDVIAKKTSQSRELAPLSRRQARALRQALSILSSADFHSIEAELSADVLHRASRDIGRIVGDIDVEDVLGTIFGQFCIGK